MIAIGTDALGGEVYGELEHLIYDNGETHTLDYYYPGMTTTSAAQQAAVKASAQMKVARKVSKESVAVERPARGEVKFTANRAEVESLPRVIRVDRKRDGAHPKAFLQGRK